MSARKPSKYKTSPGIIHPDRLYTLPAFKRELGIESSTIRAAREAGVKIYYRHRNGYIYGQDWIDYVLNSENSNTE